MEEELKAVSCEGALFDGDNGDDGKSSAGNERLVQWAESASGTFWELLGAGVTELGKGRCSVYLDVQPQHMNLLGILHGGVYASLMDSAMGMVAMDAHSQEAVVTTNLNLHYVSPIREGRLQVEAEIVHQSRHIVSAQAFARSESGDLCAFGTGTFRVLGK